jgi:ATP-dependent DNA ligase
MVKEFRGCVHIDNFSEITYPCWAEPKIDGIWVKVFLNSQGIQVLSRHGKRKKSIEKWFENEEKLIDYLSRKHIVLVGEAEYAQQWALEMMKKEKRDPVVWLFDIYPFRKYEEARKILKDVCKLSTRLKLVPSFKINSPAQAERLYKKFIKQGWEGIVLKSPDGWFKKKKEIIRKLKIVGVEWSKSKWKAIRNYDIPPKIIQAIVVKTSKGTTFRVGSMDMETRIKISCSPQKFIGKTVLIKGFEEFASGALRHPSLVKVL